MQQASFTQFPPSCAGCARPCRTMSSQLALTFSIVGKQARARIMPCKSYCDFCRAFFTPLTRNPGCALVRVRDQRAARRYCSHEPVYRSRVTRRVTHPHPAPVPSFTNCPPSHAHAHLRRSIDEALWTSNNMYLKVMNLCSPVVNMRRASRIIVSIVCSGFS